MFALPQFAGIQAPAYCQYLPTPYMTPQMPGMLPNLQDTREKRTLSPTTVTSPTTINDKKRRRNESGDIGETGDSSDSAKEPTMLDLKTYMDAIMTRLNTTATKVDILSINDKITAQNLEFDQLKSHMQKHEDDLKKLQGIIDEGLASSLHRNFQAAAGVPVCRQQI